jgi:hypothetical protein
MLTRFPHVVFVLALLLLVAPASASPRPATTTGYCGLVTIGIHRYQVLANTVSCSFAKNTATRLIRLKPKPLAPGLKTGTLPGPKGYKCLGTLGPGNIQLSGGCTKAGTVAIQWSRAT